MRKKIDKGMAQALANSAKAVVIAQPRRALIGLEIEGTAPMIQHNFSQKVLEELLRKHMGINQQREKKNPRECIEDAIIRNVLGQVCAPSVAFKSAMLTAASSLKTFERKGRLLKSTLFVEGSAIPLEFARMVPRMDMVRLSGMTRTPDVRFRPQFDDWTARLIVTYDDSLWNVQSVADLVQRSGRIGVGEWRPERNGTFGTYQIKRHISDPKEIDKVLALCAVPLKTPTVPPWALDMDIDLALLSRLVGGEASAEEAESEVERAAPRKPRNAANGAKHA